MFSLIFSPKFSFDFKFIIEEGSFFFSMFSYKNILYNLKNLKLTEVNFKFFGLFFPEFLFGLKYFLKFFLKFNILYIQNIFFFNLNNQILKKKYFNLKFDYLNDFIFKNKIKNFKFNFKLKSKKILSVFFYNLFFKFKNLKSFFFFNNSASYNNLFFFSLILYKRNLFRNLFFDLFENILIVLDIF